MRYKIALALIASFLFFNQAKCQDFWEVLPVPDTIDVASIEVNDNGDIFLASCSTYNSNGVYKSSDGGYNWIKILDSGQFGIISLGISDSGTVYALGLFEGNDLLKSTDNGLTWELIDVPEPSLNQKIFLRGEDTIFISQWRDQGAYLLRSIDGGQNWDVVFQDYGIEYVIDMAFASDGHMYIGLMCYMANGGGIYSSTDGGANWDFLGLENHQISSISIDSSDNLLITVWSNMIDISISGIIYYNAAAEMFSPLIFAWGSWGSEINSNNEFFTTFEYGTLHSVNSGQSFEILSQNIANTGNLYLDDKQILYAYDHSFNNFLVKSVQPTVTATSKFKVIYDGLNIAPNPVNDRLNGTLSLNLADVPAEIEIFDVTGKSLIKSQVDIDNDRFSIDVSKIKKGFYIVQITLSNTIYSAKIVKS